MRALFRVVHDRTGNLPPMPGVFPDYPAPIVGMVESERELLMARWGMPTPQFALKGTTTDPGATNIRNTASPHWRRWLGPANRCLVPFTSFSEYETTPDKKKIPVWFALDESRPLAAFAGIWTNWTSVRKAKEGEVTVDVFAFLTTEPNAIVAPHPPEGHAGDPDDRRGIRRLAAGAGSRGDGVTAAAGGWRVEDPGEGRATRRRVVRRMILP